MRLVPATRRLVDTELTAPAGLATALRARLPADWPPEHHDERTLAFTRERLAGGDREQGWWLHYVLIGGEDPTVVGTAGYKGPPEEGTIEIGYSVVPTFRRRGIATRAAQQLVAAEVERDPTITTVLAHTLPELAPSIGVLRKLGFTEAGSPEPGVLRFSLRVRGHRVGS